MQHKATSTKQSSPSPSSSSSGTTTATPARPANIESVKHVIKTCLYSLVLLLVPLVIYSNSVQNTFLNQDVVVTLDPASTNTAIRFNTNRSSTDLITTLSFQLDAKITELNEQPQSSAESYHLTNIILHGIITIQVFLLASRVISSTRTSSFAQDLCCFLGALFFALHPIATEHWHSSLLAAIATWSYTHWLQYCHCTTYLFVVVGA
ncbi:hypothetical protein SAMD00019534_123340 [Acytostelium subglobosum LB1]|uniref:hypothetical protein n=1 Tax=Acytostelium subglobosum LB1 TaxID=1410327 RepID=UPI0006450980|nr:hypothetical protein SAMD00019534_123340 [Acytostelium subglobosum LB1]GAM29158.1 hypothetical protein SAMD00019534_123340 [Acytostelium subglobosum LB1]|eukprot:XP_012747849.1 hypothetical protein SAMD00019534_123340 [Acytostelium subglobosum LB1]